MKDNTSLHSNDQLAGTKATNIESLEWTQFV